MPKYTEFQEDLHKLLESYDPDTLYEYNNSVEHAVIKLYKEVYGKFIDNINEFCENKSSEYNLDKFIEKICMKQSLIHVRVNTDLMYCKLMLKLDIIPFLVTCDEFEQELLKYFEHKSSSLISYGTTIELSFDKCTDDDINSKLKSFYSSKPYYTNNAYSMYNRGGSYHSHTKTIITITPMSVYQYGIRREYQVDFRKE